MNDSIRCKHIHKAADFSPIPKMANLVPATVIGISEIDGQNDKGRNEAHARTPAHAAHCCDDGCRFMHRIGITVAIVRGKAYEAQACTTKEGKELDTPARIEQADEHQEAYRNQDQREEPTHVPRLLKGSDFAARTALQLIVGIAHHIRDAEAQSHQQQISSKQEE